jgi:hypothetical protein
MTTPNPLDRITWRGKTLDRKTAAALAIVERRLGYTLTVVQGSYHKGVGASAGTHDRGGVVDLAPYDWANKVKTLRRIGFAAWHRPAIKGLWGEHVHAVLIGHEDLAPSAARQVDSYKAGRDGLAGNRRDPDQYRPKVEPFDYAAAWRDGLLRKNVLTLQGRIRTLRERIAAQRARITYK